MTITDDRTDLGPEESALGVPEHRVSAALRRTTRSQCECPDFCPVQHDNDN